MPNISRTGNAAFTPYQSAASESIRNSPWLSKAQVIRVAWLICFSPATSQSDAIWTPWKLIEWFQQDIPVRQKKTRHFRVPSCPFHWTFRSFVTPLIILFHFLFFFKMKIRRKRREKRRKTKRKKKVHVLASPLLARSETHRHFSLSSSFFSFYHNKFRWVALHFFDYPCYDYFIGKPNGVFGLLFQGILKKYIYIYISFLFFFKLLSSISSFCSG